MLVKALKFSGADLKKMTNAGVTPGDFASIDFAQKQLVGRKCWVYAEKNGKYTNIDFVEESDVPSDVLYGQAAPDKAGDSGVDSNGHEVLEESDIPF